MIFIIRFLKPPFINPAWYHTAHSKSFLPLQLIKVSPVAQTGLKGNQV